MTRKRSHIEDGAAAIAEVLAIQKAFRARRRLLLVAARGLLAARRQHHCNREFAKWLRRSPYSKLSRNDRAALISVALHAKAIAPFLRSTNTANPTLLWRQARRWLRAEGRLP